MAKLIKILAASVGGGLVLGAGIRLGEAIATWDPDSPPHAQKLARRLGELENRLQNLEGDGGGISEGVEEQADAVSAVRSQIRTDQQHVEVFSENSVRLRGELLGWLEESVAARMAEVESRLKAESERGQKQMLDAFIENVQTRVIQRISHLEEEVAGQSAAMSELRECSLRTERSIQKLLGGLDRLVVRQPDPLTEEPAKQDPAKEERNSRDLAQPDVAQPAPPFVAPARSARWKIFG